MKTKMKTTLFLIMLTIVIGFTACTKDSTDPIETVITETITELDARGENIGPSQGMPIFIGDYTKFSFSEGAEVDGDNWDVAFRATRIIVNGGIASDTLAPNRTGNAAVYIIGDGSGGVDGAITMGDIASVNEDLLTQDDATSPAIMDDYGFPIPPATEPLGWCKYNLATNVVSPRSGTILVFRTHDNKYAKVEITSFYDTPNPPSSYLDLGGFYTFHYVYQSEEGNTTF